MEESALKGYYQDFGKADDLCLVYEIDGSIAGAVCTRIIDSEPKGFGYVDIDTPEFGIYLCKQYRGLGIGTEFTTPALCAT